MVFVPSSLSIAPQVVSCYPRRNHLHNYAIRATIRLLETRNASCPAPVKDHHEPGGKRFDHIDYHRQRRSMRKQ